MRNHVEEFREDLKEFDEMTDKFYKKEINVAQYKGFSGGFGSYAQRGGSASMLRLRLSGGEITKDDLKFIADSVEKYDISLTHITTCQSLQLHNLSAAQVCALIQESFDYGIITRGGGGDFPRNVMCSPLSGVQQGEYFDVLPYAKEAADYLLGFIKTVKLPRKLKVCFSNCEENVTHATFRDLGFTAKENGSFDVYSAGGLGREPRMGALVASDVAPDKILYYIKAMVDTFTAHGNYENRGKARTRFMQDTLGTEGYIKAYRDKLKKVLAEENLDLSITLPESAKQGDGRNSRVSMQSPTIPSAAVQSLSSGASYMTPSCLWRMCWYASPRTKACILSTSPPLRLRRSFHLQQTAQTTHLSRLSPASAPPSARSAQEILKACCMPVLRECVKKTSRTASCLKSIFPAVPLPVLRIKSRLWASAAAYARHRTARNRPSPYLKAAVRLKVRKLSEKIWASCSNRKSPNSWQSSGMKLLLGI